ncbi:hypothetical protein D3C81_2260680 [compost metagenome]
MIARKYAACESVFKVKNAQHRAVKHNGNAKNRLRLALRDIRVMNQPTFPSLSI